MIETGISSATKQVVIVSKQPIVLVGECIKAEANGISIKSKLGMLIINCALDKN